MSLKKDLNKIFENSADGSEELAPSGSTQANEAINSIVGTKAPKIRHFGYFESSDFRCAAAIQVQVQVYFITNYRLNEP